MQLEFHQVRIGKQWIVLNCLTQVFQQVVEKFIASRNRHAWGNSTSDLLRLLQVGGCNKFVRGIYVCFVKPLLDRGLGKGNDLLERINGFDIKP